jgi:hypothetical protein
MRTDKDFHRFWLWCLQKRYPWIYHSAFRVDYISSYLSLFCGVRYGTCDVIRNASSLDSDPMFQFVGKKPLHLSNEHKIFKSCKLLTDIGREKALGLVRDVTKLTLDLGPRELRIGSTGCTDQGTFVKSIHMAGLLDDARSVQDFGVSSHQR